MRAADGTHSIIQPLIAPLHDGKTDAEVVELLLGGTRGAYALVREQWRGQLSDAAWRESLHSGVVKAAGVFADVTRAAEPTLFVAAAQAFKPAPKNGLEVVFYADAHRWDGRYANNGWLNEMPDPMTKVTWGNAALLSPATAKALGVGLSLNTDVLQFDHLDTEVIEISVNGAKISTPALIVPGHADDSISLSLGWGRTAGGKIATGTFAGGNGDSPSTGVDVTGLRSSDGFWSVQGASATKTLSKYRPLGS